VSTPANRYGLEIPDAELALLARDGSARSAEWVEVVAGELLEWRQGRLRRDCAEIAPEATRGAILQSDCKVTGDVAGEDFAGGNY
jgi:hypothetical protein